MKHKIGNILGIVLIAIFLPIVIVNTTLAIKGSIAPEKVATFLGYGPLIVETGSMRPEFKEQDLLIVKSTDAGKLEKGDVIAFYDANGTVVSHRIIGYDIYDIDETGARLYITQGDANNVQDRDPVPAARVAGLVVCVIPDGGKFMEFARKPIVMGLVITVPLGRWFCYSSLAKALDRKKEKQMEKGVTAQTDEAQPQE
jgi:signal peptidase